jgi:hypothetical protein
MGATVFFGMIGVTSFGLFLTPVFYSLVRRYMHRPRDLETLPPILAATPVEVPHA